VAHTSLVEPALSTALQDRTPTQTNQIPMLRRRFRREIKSAGLSWIKAAKIRRNKIFLLFSLTDGANK
jgi:hypothetical protein